MSPASRTARATGSSTRKSTRRRLATTAATAWPPPRRRWTTCWGAASPDPSIRSRTRTTASIRAARTRTTASIWAARTWTTASICGGTPGPGRRSIDLGGSDLDVDAPDPSMEDDAGAEPDLSAEPAEDVNAVPIDRGVAPEGSAQPVKPAPADGEPRDERRARRRGRARRSSDGTRQPRRLGAPHRRRAPPVFRRRDAHRPPLAAGPRGGREAVRGRRAGAPRGG